jgi:hypothetical protein
MDWTGALLAELNIGANPSASLGTALSTYGSQCQAAIEREIGRTFDNFDYCEVYDGNDRDVLYLNHDPIVSLTSVSVSGTPLTVQTSTVFSPTAPPTFPLAQCVPDGSRLRLTDGTTFSGGAPLNVIVVYKAGLTDPATLQPPLDLVRAVIYWSEFLYSMQDRMGWTSQTIGDQMTAFAQNIPDDIKQMIAAWRRPLIP